MSSSHPGSNKRVSPTGEFCQLESGIAVLSLMGNFLFGCWDLRLKLSIELIQIQKVVLSLGDYMGVACHACIGGTNVREDQRILGGGDGGVHIVVGTPGRVYDMINRRALDPRCFINYSLLSF